MTIKRTTDRLPPKRYGRDPRIVFDDGKRETDAYDLETEQRAVETFDELEFADEEDEAAAYVTEPDEETEE